MKNTVKSFLLFAGILLSLTGCQKGNFGEVGQEVRFGAVTGQPETRTSYSNSNEGDTSTENWERIDWTKGDVFRVYSSVAKRPNGDHFSDYYVSSVTENGNISKAGIDNVESGSLAWGQGVNDFYGLFPNDGFTVAEANGKVSSATAEIPAEQALTKAEDGEYYPDMKYAFMLASAEAEPKSSVELDFYPYFTAFEFEVSADKTMEITGFRMISTDKGDSYAATPLSGEFKASFDEDESKWTVGDAPEISDANRSITATFEPIALTLEEGATETNTAHFTVFAAPRDLTSITFEFTVKVDGVEETRSLFVSYAKGENAGKPVEFAACKKHYFKGVYIQDNWDFDYLTLDIDVLDWEEVKVTESNGKGVQATQFAVSFNDGASESTHNLRYVKTPNDKNYRQCWVFNPTYQVTTGEGDDATTEDRLTVVTITYKIMMPTSGTFGVEALGDTDAFNVSVNSPNGGTVTKTGNVFSGALAAGATYINIIVTVPPKYAEDDTQQQNPIYPTELKTLYFNTTASDGTTTYNLDSETQLYDMRGYHYFIVNGNASTTWDLMFKQEEDEEDHE